MNPDSIEQISDRVITIRWDDGHESVYFADHLRRNCPCAVCAKEKGEKEAGPFKILKTDVKNVHFTGWNMIGRYAVGFSFSDGHKTGIYPYENLRGLCQCDLCAEDMIRIRGPFH